MAARLSSHPPWVSQSLCSPFSATVRSNAVDILIRVSSLSGLFISVARLALGWGSRIFNSDGCCQLVLLKMLLSFRCPAAYESEASLDSHQPVPPTPQSPQPQCEDELWRGVARDGPALRIPQRPAPLTCCSSEPGQKSSCLWC